MFLDGFIRSIENINTIVHDALWGPFMLALMIGTGIYFTVRLRFFQVSHFFHWMKATIFSLRKGSSAQKGAITPFKALSTALASTIGVGNIAGVATAIVAGGPGAIFWMWVSAFFGMMTKYAEVVLALHFRKRNDRGEWVGGAMYYIEYGLKMKWLACAFAVMLIIATFGMGGMAQANAFAGSVKAAFGIDPSISGIVLVIFVGAVIVGGLQRIASVTSVFVPVMSVFYMLGGIALLFIFRNNLGNAASQIFTSAFNLKSAGGGILGYGILTAMRMGISRGVFSNEAGLGSAPIVHAAADVKHPAQQGMWGIFEVFVDTIVVCTMTALIILSSGVVGAVDSSGELVNGAALTALAFNKAIPVWGNIFLSVAIFFFALATIIGWSYYGEKALHYLFGQKGMGKKGALIYRLCYLVALVIGSSLSLDLIWKISDTFNAMMALPNLFAILMLSGLVSRLTKDYLDKRDKLQL